MPVQSASWTCSACSLAWIIRATGANENYWEWDAVNDIGTPQNINSTYGLMDSSGSALRTVLRKYGFATDQGWLTYQQVFSLAGNYVICMSGGAWYHWVSVRGRNGANLWIANSAPGYKGVYDILSETDFQRLGPFSVVWVMEYL